MSVLGSAGRLWYRARQFGNVFRARLRPEEEALVRVVLTPAQQRLFWAMHPVARRHHLDVCRALQRQGWRDPEVLAAALLHDVGKGHLGPWARAVIVVVGALAPGLLAAGPRSGRPAGGPRAWLAAHVRHAEDGAALVAAAGGAARTVALIRCHERGGSDPALHALRRADDSH
ncbi:MAG: hypothetical protein HY689_10575 [Chloroflexi bacterium]|nr:hypothetical protein [Chloroflexota bacterium]